MNRESVRAKRASRSGISAFHTNPAAAAQARMLGTVAGDLAERAASTQGAKP